MTTSIDTGSILILRTRDAEISFSGGEYETAMAMARRYEKQGRASLIAYTHRPGEKPGRRNSVEIIYPAPGRQELPLAAA